jgi:ribosome silencing factor RsfS/YbeB/iojap
LSAVRRKIPRKSPKRRVNGVAAKAGASALAPSPAKTARARLDKLVATALDDMKAVNVKVIDVHKLSDIFDTLVIASGNSDRHVRSIAERLVQQAKAAGHPPLGVEGQKTGDWVLVDLGDYVVHVMLPRVREFYGLEKLWSVS